MLIKKQNRRVKLGKCPIGLFLFEDCLCLKTEYWNNGKPECYIVSSGEYFVGGVLEEDKFLDLMVIPLNVEMGNQQGSRIFPSDAHSFEVFAIKDCKESPTGKEAYIGCKLANGNFHFVGVPFTEPYEDSSIDIIESRKKGILKKQEGSWQVHSNGKTLPLHPADASQLEIDSNGDILIGKEIEFEIQGLYAKYCLPKHMEIDLS